MKCISEYLFENIELTNEQLDDTAYQVAATVTAMQAFGDNSDSGSGSDEPGIIRSIIDSIKDKRKQKIVAGAFEKLKNDKDIEELFQKLRKQYIEEFKKINRKHHLDKSEEELDVMFDKYVKAYHNVGVLNHERKDEMIKLIKSKLDKKELKYINDIFDEIRHQKEV